MFRCAWTWPNAGITWATCCWRRDRPKGRSRSWSRRVTSARPWSSSFPMRLAIAHNLAGDLRNLGRAYEAAGQAAAQSSFQESLKISEQLASDFPANMDYQIELGRCLNSLGSNLAAANQADQAESCYTRGLAVLDFKDKAARNHGLPPRAGHGAEQPWRAAPSRRSPGAGGFAAAFDLDLRGARRSETRRPSRPPDAGHRTEQSGGSPRGRGPRGRGRSAVRDSPSRGLIVSRRVHEGRGHSELSGLCLRTASQAPGQDRPAREGSSGQSKPRWNTSGRPSS